MNVNHSSRLGSLCLLALLMLAAVSPAHAGGGYFGLGYGPLARQMAGTSTAVGLDAFAGASNPGKLSAVGDRLDIGLEFFMPYRRIERTGSGSIYDFDSNSKNPIFFLPEAGYARRINERLAWGIALYGNGGLNTEYRDTTRVPGSNFNPAQCGAQPANFFFGCGKFGFDLAQIIVAPTVAWQFAPGQSFGIAPLLAYQHIDIYGLQALEAVSARPRSVSNRGYDRAFGAGVRVGWYGEITPWLDLGAAYSTRIYMQDFSKYRGLFAEGGSFDAPENFSVGAALKLTPEWVIGVDIQRINFGDVKSLGNGVLNSLQGPGSPPLGSRNGSGFNWRNQTNYRLGLEYVATARLTARAGYAYGRRPNDQSINSVSFNLLAPNPIHQISAGLSWALNGKNDLHFSYGRYMKEKYNGPSATAGFGVGGVEQMTAHVDTVYVGWSRRL